MDEKSFPFERDFDPTKLRTCDTTTTYDWISMQSDFQHLKLNVDKKKLNCDIKVLGLLLTDPFKLELKTNIICRSVDAVRHRQAPYVTNS